MSDKKKSSRRKMKVFLLSFSDLSHHRAYWSRTRRFVRMISVVFQHCYDTFGRSLLIPSWQVLCYSSFLSILGYVPFYLLLYSYLTIDKTAIWIHLTSYGFAFGSLSSSNIAKTVSWFGFLVTHLTGGIYFSNRQARSTESTLRLQNPNHSSVFWPVVLYFSEGVFAISLSSVLMIYLLFVSAIDLSFYKTKILIMY